MFVAAGLEALHFRRADDSLEQGPCFQGFEPTI